jgi:hypothetical protein
LVEILASGDILRRRAIAGEQAALKAGSGAGWTHPALGSKLAVKWL